MCPVPSTAAEQYLLELTNEARFDRLRNAASYLSFYAPLTSSQPRIQSALTVFGMNGPQLRADGAGQRWRRHADGRGGCGYG